MQLRKPSLFTRAALFPLVTIALAAQTPQAISGGYALPNGWRLTPAGKSLETSDMVLNTTIAPDGQSVIAMHAGYNPHGLVVIDTKTEQIVQRIPLKSAWFGLAWSPDGKRLFVSGGNANGNHNPTRAPIYAFDYSHGRLSKEPSAQFEETVDASQLSGPASLIIPGRTFCTPPIAAPDSESETWLRSIPLAATFLDTSRSK